MFTKSNGIYLALALALALIFTASCSKPATDETAAKPSTDSASSLSTQVESAANDKSSQSDANRSDDDEHGHIAGAHGGAIVPIGRDSYHVEPVFDNDGKLTLYMLQADESKVLEVESQILAAFAKTDSSNSTIEFEIQPDPQADDPENKTSRFAAIIPEELRGGEVIQVTIPSIRIEGERFRLSFNSPEANSHGMPDKVADQAERELYLTPGGIYTQTDIEANGSRTASQKFRGFMAAHDMNPKSGDKICPITHTKANSKCDWIIGGEKYEFCCPPCVDEFVKLAKEDPEKIQSPDDYVKE